MGNGLGIGAWKKYTPGKTLQDYIREREAYKTGVQPTRRGWVQPRRWESRIPLSPLYDGSYKLGKKVSQYAKYRGDRNGGNYKLQENGSVDSERALSGCFNALAFTPLLFLPAIGSVHAQNSSQSPGVFVNYLLLTFLMYIIFRVGADLSVESQTISNIKQRSNSSRLVSRL